MNTFLLSILVAKFALEAVCAFLIYKRRHQIRYALQQFLGITYLNDVINAQYTQSERMAKTLRFVRRDQMGGKKLKKSDRDAEILAFAKAGKIVDAVKLYREVYDVGLKEALDAVRALPVN